MEKLYCIEYILGKIPKNPLDGNHKHTREAFLKEDREFSDEGPLLDDKTMMLEPKQFHQIHRWVLLHANVDGLEVYYR